MPSIPAPPARISTPMLTFEKPWEGPPKETMAEPPLRFAALGLDHRHIYHQVGRLLELGYECAGYWTDGDPQPLGGFLERFPDLERVSSLHVPCRPTSPPAQSTAPPARTSPQGHTSAILMPTRFWPFEFPILTYNNGLPLASTGDDA